MRLRVLVSERRARRGGHSLVGVGGFWLLGCLLFFFFLLPLNPLLFSRGGGGGVTHVRVDIEGVVGVVGSTKTARQGWKMLGRFRDFSGIKNEQPQRCPS